jgi:hypothetical protein
MARFLSHQQLSERIALTPQGFLLCQDVAIARTGVQQYFAGELGMTEYAADKVLDVHRMPEDVFHPDTLASFEAATVTFNHPAQWVTADNWRQLAHGHLQNVRRGVGDQAHLMMCDMLITDAATIKLVQDGLREVSCGYDCVYIRNSDGNLCQTEIRGNHLAIVPQGRCGSECSIKDAAMKIKDKITALFSKASIDALALLPAAVTDCACAGATVDTTTGVVTIAAAADVSAIVAELMQRLMAVEAYKKDLDEQVESLTEAVNLLTNGQVVLDPATLEEPATVDAATIARAEILAPGCAKVPGVELAALTAAYATDAGRKVIDMLTGGHAPTDATHFVPAAELIKMQRSQDLQTRAPLAAPVIDAIAHIKAQSAKLHPLF